MTQKHSSSLFLCEVAWSVKVNMAAQVLSFTVANALEMLYGDNISETVKFLRVMNRFFDCINMLTFIHPNGVIVIWFLVSFGLGLYKESSQCTSNNRSKCNHEMSFPSFNILRVFLPDLNPYRSTDDDRLRWLKEDFLQYFTEWEQSVMNRPGNFTQKEKKGMLLSHQTLTPIIISGAIRIQIWVAFVTAFKQVSHIHTVKKPIHYTQNIYGF
jgi:hypothetical protein